MANKKLINCDQLQTAVEKVKEYVDTKDATKSNSSHGHGNITNAGGLSGKSAVVVTDANGLITSSSKISTTELDALDGISSNIQTQLDGKASSGHAHGNVSNTGTLGTASAVVVTDANKNITASTTITTTELGYLDGVTSNVQTQLNNKASSSHVHGDISNTGTLPNASTVVIADANKKITNSTITTTELGYLSGVTSSIQTQLNNKAGSSHAHGNISNGGALSGKSMAVITDANGLITTSSTISTTELGYLDGVTSNVQNQLNSKAGSGHTHGNLTNGGALGTANAVAVTDGNKLLTASTSITTTELGYLDGVSSNVQDQLNAKAPTSHASTATTYGVSSAANYGHAMASSTTPKANGTAAVGSETAKFARGDHVHPIQTSVSGNAGTADKWKTPRKITWTGDATGEVTLDGSADKEASLTLVASGVTAGSYGPSANASPAHAGTFSVPYITVDAKGRVTGASTKTITLPADNDTKVTNTLATTTKAYITGTTSATTATGTQVFDTGVYLTTTAGELAATKFTGALNGNANTASTWATSRNFTIKDNDETNSGPASSVNGGGNVTLKLPATIKASITGNASTASKLSPGKKINNTLFDGSADITTAKWGASRTLTIGNKGQSVDGSENVSWSLSDIGALPSAGGTATGNITINTSTGARYKATNGTNTVWFGLNSSGDRWGIYDETNGKYIVESSSSGSSFLGNATSATQAAKADQLTNERTINGTKFNGSANITTANWGTARSITIGNTAKSVNGSSAYSWTLNEIGAAKGQTISATTAATAGWYRIATSVAGINRNMGIFTIDATVSGKHSVTVLSAGICYGQAPSLVQLSHAEHSATGISQARIVYHTTYSGNYAYLEVCIPTSTATTINVHMADYFGWSLVAPSTAGSIPSGYTNKTLTLLKGGIAADKAAITTLTAGVTNLAGNLTFDNAKSIFVKTAADYTNTNAGTSVPKGTAMNILTYNSSGNLHLGLGPHDNYLSTGNVYLSSPNNMYLRSVNNGVHSMQVNGNTVFQVEKDRVVANKAIIAKGGVISDSANTDDLGTSTVPWKTMFIRAIGLRSDTTGTPVGSLEMETAGTTSTQGISKLILGNNLASGTATNAKGYIRMYGTNTGRTDIAVGNNTTSNITITLPSATGTLVTSGDVTNTLKNYLPLSGGTITGTLKVNNTLTTGANIVSDTAVTDSLGTSTVPWLHTYSRYFSLRINGTGTGYGSLCAQTVGKTDANGLTRLELGNNIASKTADNASGEILLYGTNTAYTRLAPGNNTTTNATLTLPSATGTLARTADNVASATKVHTTLGTTTKAYLLATATAPTSTSTAVNTIGDTGVYLTTNAGQMQLNSLIVNSNIYPDAAVGANIGEATLPWGTTYSKIFEIYGGANAKYGSLRVQTAGTTDAQGDTRLILGNATNKGTANNARGTMLLYGTNTGYTYIVPGNNGTSNITLTLPSAEGTLATTANIDSKVASYLPLAGGTMTGNITFNNNLGLISKTAAAITDTAGATVAAGTTIKILEYNGSDNLHIGRDIYEKKLTKGNTYISGGGGMSIRTNAGSISLSAAGTSVMTLSDSQVDVAKNIYAKAGVKTGGNIVSDTALTDNIGTDAIPFNYTKARYFQVFGEASKQYGNLRADVLGTTSTVGQTVLTLGNSTASGTAGNAQGEINFYSSGAGYVKIKNRAALSSGVTVQLPSASGQLPLMVADAADYWGILPPTGNASCWLRSPQSGLIPYEKNSEISSLGTSSWPWYNVCGKNFGMYDKNGQSYGYMKVVTDGTANDQGETRLTLGNNLSSGAAKNSYGRISLYGTNTGYTMITPGNNSTSNITLTLPSSTGTLARTADKTAGWSTARTLTIGATGKSVDGTGNVSWSLQEIMKGQGLNYDTAMNTLYFNNAGTSHKGRVTVYNNGTNDYLQLALRTADATINSLQLYPTKTTIGQALEVEGNVTLNNDKDTNYQAFDAHRSCSSATDSSSGTYYAVADYTYSTARFGCVNSFGGCAALETRHNGVTVGYFRVLPNGGIQLGSGKKLHIQASAPTKCVSTGDVWIDI